MEGELVMFLMDEALSSDGKRLATISMTEDGLFEGRLYRLVRKTEDAVNEAMRFDDIGESCGTADTFARIQTVVYEELGLTLPVD